MNATPTLTPAEVEAFGAEIDALVALGLLDWTGGRLRLTSRGTMLANDVCARFL
mgnify:CR=1 FL=1